jgi:hypothetical protein
MSTDGFWDLFEETGDIGFYLLYAESTQTRNECKSEKISGEKCEYS